MTELEKLYEEAITPTDRDKNSLLCVDVICSSILVFVVSLSLSISTGIRDIGVTATISFMACVVLFAILVPAWLRSFYFGPIYTIGRVYHYLRIKKAMKNFKRDADHMKVVLEYLKKTSEGIASGEQKELIGSLSKALDEAKTKEAGLKRRALDNKLNVVALDSISYNAALDEVDSETNKLRLSK